MKMYVENFVSSFASNALNIRGYMAAMLWGIFTKVLIPVMLYTLWWRDFFPFLPQGVHTFLEATPAFLALILWCVYAFISVLTGTRVKVTLTQAEAVKMFPFLFGQQDLSPKELSEFLADLGLWKVQTMEISGRVPSQKPTKAIKKIENATVSVSPVVDHPVNQFLNDLGEGRYNIHLAILAGFLAVLAIVNNLGNGVLWLMLTVLGILWLSTTFFYKGPVGVKHDFYKSFQYALIGGVGIGTLIFGLLFALTRVSLPFVNKISLFTKGQMSNVGVSVTTTPTQEILEPTQMPKVERLSLEDNFVLPGTILNTQAVDAGIGEVASIVSGVNTYTQLMQEILVKVQGSTEALPDLTPYIDGVNGQGGLKQASADLTCWSAGGCNLSDGSFLEKSFSVRVEETSLTLEEKAALKEPIQYINLYWKSLGEMTQYLQQIGVACEGKTGCNEAASPGIADLWGKAKSAQTQVITAAVQYNTWSALQGSAVTLQIPNKIVEGFFATSQRVPEALQITATPRPTIERVKPTEVIPTQQMATETPTPTVFIAPTALPTDTPMPSMVPSSTPEVINTLEYIPMLQATYPAMTFEPTSTRVPTATYDTSWTSLTPNSKFGKWMRLREATSASSSTIGCGDFNGSTPYPMITDNGVQIKLQFWVWDDHHVENVGCDVQVVLGRKTGTNWFTITIDGEDISIYPFQ